MEQVQFFLRVSLFVLLLSAANGILKGQRSSIDPGSGGSSSLHYGARPGHPKSVPYPNVAWFPQYVPVDSPPLPELGPAPAGAVPAGSSSGHYGEKPSHEKPAVVPHQQVAQLPQYLPAQLAVGQMPGGYPVYPAPVEGVQTGYPTGPASLVPVQPAPHSSLPETSWAVPPKNFAEAAAEATAASSNTQALDSSSASSPGFLPGPVLQSGETSNIVKEAEQANYQQQTEEFGYPAEPVVPAPGFPMVPLPGFGGPWGYPSYPRPYPFPYPYPNFDYRLLYGLYPPGTYSTFSKNHEKGTDYYHSTHYLKEHVSDGPDTPGPGQQQKLFRA